ncbi:MAG TPA: hypothetical protein VFV67_09580 [Actinophytocola sp.]|nr:hypothetical protein [Actinophytocola sp.]HEU5470890.1 hypothetical protein [Actinophytocola sp.]
MVADKEIQLRVPGRNTRHGMTLTVTSVNIDKQLPGPRCWRSLG